MSFDSSTATMFTSGDMCKVCGNLQRRYVPLKKPLGGFILSQRVGASREAVAKIDSASTTSLALLVCKPCYQNRNV
jgi:hypothetical protein